MINKHAERLIQLLGFAVAEELREPDPDYIIKKIIVDRAFHARSEAVSRALRKHRQAKRESEVSN